MAYQPQNFNVQNQVPMASIIQAYQNKAAQETKAKQAQAQAERAKLQDTLQTIGMASKLVQQGVNLSKAKQQKDAQRAMAESMLSGGDPFATGQMTQVPSPKGFGLPGTTMDVPEMGTRAQHDPSWKTQLLSQLAETDPTSFNKYGSQEVLKSMFKDKVDPLTDLSGRDVQTQEFLMKDGSRKMLSIYETTYPPKVVDVSSGDVLAPEEMQGMRRAPTQSFEKAGYTQTGKQIVRNREGDLIANGEEYNGPVYERLKTPPTNMVEGLSALKVAKGTLSDVESLFKPSLTGPVAGRYQSVAKLLNSLTEEQRTEFNTALWTYKNSMIKAITGAQMSEPEAKRLMRQMPDSNTSPKNFLSQLNQAKREAERALKIKEATYKQAGYVMRREDHMSEEEAAAFVEDAMSDIPLSIEKNQKAKAGWNSTQSGIPWRIKQ